MTKAKQQQKNQYELIKAHYKRYACMKYIV